MTKAQSEEIVDKLREKKVYLTNSYDDELKQWRVHISLGGKWHTVYDASKVHLVK